MQHASFATEINDDYHLRECSTLAGEASISRSCVRDEISGLSILPDDQRCLTNDIDTYENTKLER